MDISSIQWLSDELGLMDDPTFTHQCQTMNSLEDFMTSQQMETALGEEFLKQYSFSSESYSTLKTFNPPPPPGTTTTTTFITSSSGTGDRPMKQLKTNNSCWNSCTTQHISIIPEATSSPQLLSFANAKSPQDPQQFYGSLSCNITNPKDEAESINLLHSDILIAHQVSNGNQSYESKAGQETKKISAVNRPPSHSQDHIMAERKRREKLSEQFIALSAMVPGLKKMDKASVLGDAIKYMKQLQERMKQLEEQTAKKTVESVVFIKKSQILAAADDESSSCDENFNGNYCSNEPIPEIEARVSDKNVLVRIHCEKQKGILVKALREIEKLHLTVVNSNIVPFGNSALDITIVAQMDVEFCTTLKDLVRNLRSAFQQFM